MSAAFVIEKGVPIPRRNPSFGWGLHGAVCRLEVGDSIFVANGKPNSVSASGRVATQRTGAKFTTRRVEGGVRIWRVS